MNKLIDEIRRDIEYLYEKHDLLVRGIQVSHLTYINIQDSIIRDMSTGRAFYNYINMKPLTMDDIPVIICDDIRGDYELMVSIPSYRLGEKDE